MEGGDEKDTEYCSTLLFFHRVTVGPAHRFFVGENCYSIVHEDGVEIKITASGCARHTSMCIMEPCKVRLVAGAGTGNTASVIAMRRMYKRRWDNLPPFPLLLEEIQAC
jgi:hypothetical protein